jgi:hypothetical protein
LFMRAKLPPQVVQRVLETAKKTIGIRVDYQEIGRFLFTQRHCGARMVQVKNYCKVYNDFPFGEDNRHRACDVAVCPVCDYAYTLGTDQ